MINKLDTSLVLIQQDLSWSNVTNFLINAIKVSRAIDDLIHQVSELLLGKVGLLTCSSFDFLFQRVRIKGKGTLCDL